MSNLNYKQVAGASRRKWDVETYEKRAQSRQQALEKGETLATSDETKKKNYDNDDDDDDDDKEEFRPAIKGAARPEGSDGAFLQARSTGVMKNLESQVGQSTFVDTSGGGGPSKTDGVTATGVGWHCKVCDCFLKDSHTYLDHINGRKHQRKLGFSMRVQRSTTDDLKSKLQALKQKKQAKPEDEIDFNERVEQKDKELLERQEERRRRRKERKQKAKQEQHEEKQEPQEDETEEGNEQQEEAEEEEEAAEIDPALAAMMGFSGFGGSAKS